MYSERLPRNCDRPMKMKMSIVKDHTSRQNYSRNADERLKLAFGAVL